MNSITESEHKQYKCDKCHDGGWIKSNLLGGCKIWCGHCDAVKLECRIDSLTGQTYHVRLEPKEL